MQFYRQMLRLYPQAHRVEYGEAMVQLFGDRWRDERPSRSPLHWIAFWGGIVGDVAKTALTERTEGSMVSFKQNWWMWLAGLLGVLQLMGVAGFGLDSDSTTTGRVVGASIAGLSSALVFFGLRQIGRNPGLGGLLIGIGVIPSAFVGAVFFWFPPIWLVSIAGIAVMVKAFQEVVAAKRDRPSVAVETA